MYVRDKVVPMIIVHVSDVTEEREEEAGMARMSPCHIHPNKSNIEGRVKKQTNIATNPT